MDGIIAGIASLLGGGVSGILGAAISKYADYKQKQLEFSQTLELRKIDLQFLDREWEGKATIASIEGEAAEQVALTNLQAESHASDTARYSDQKSSPWLLFVDVCRGLVRPIATVYFVIFASLLYWQVADYLGSLDQALTSEQIYEIYFYCILWVLYTAGMTIGWWFGIRPAAAPAQPRIR